MGSREIPTRLMSLGVSSLAVATGFSLGQSNVARDVAGLGPSLLRPPSGATERVLRPMYEANDAGAFADAVISHTLLTPRLSYDDVHRLPSATRADLRRMVVAACALPEPASATDDSLLAAMRERDKWLERRSAGNAASLASYVAGWLDEMRERAHAAVRGADLGKVIAAAVQTAAEAGEAAELILKVYDEQPLAFVVLEAHVESSFELLVGAAEHGDHVLADMLQTAVIADRDFVAASHDAVQASGSLTDGQKEELAVGLAALQHGHPRAACPLLMGGVEGAIWTAAARETIIDTDRYLLKTEAPGRPKMRLATSVNNLLDGQHGLQVGSHYRHFLHDKLFNGRGHDLRHGRTHEGAEEYAKWAFVALLGWLDRSDKTEFMEQVGDRFDATLERALAKAA